MVGAALVLAGLASAGRAAVPCGQVAADVTGATPGERAIICRASHTATDLLRRCGMSLDRRLRIEVARSPGGACDERAFGTFAFSDRRIRIVGAADCATVPPDSPFGGLTPDALYESIVVHEVAHAVFWHALAGRTVSQTAHEYVAYAIQLEAMAPQARARFLAARRRAPATDLSAFNDRLLGMAPEDFAALAYRHFAAPAHGCGVLEGIVSGAFVFPPMPE